MGQVDIEYPLLDNKDGEEEKECGLLKKSFKETKTMWMIAGPVMFTMVCQFSMDSITQMFLGHVGNIELAAFSVQNANIDDLIFGIMLGMGSALETLCGQAYGTGRLDMLGVYMQRSWVILTFTAMLFIPLCIFAAPVLKFLGQDHEISDLAGTVAIWLIPQILSYAFNFPIQKFLQAQSKVMAMAFISAGVCVFHAILSWLFILKFGWGLLGATLIFTVSSWLVVIGQFLYIISGACPGAWNGFSWLAFKDLGAFLRLSMSSAVMLCLEIWYYCILILLTGQLANAEIAVDSISVCLNVIGWEFMIPLALNAAISVRVSNELGASHPNAAKFSMLVATITSVIIGIFLGVSLFMTKGIFPSIFTNSAEVMKAVEKLGVAVGAGWQEFVAYVNIACYYLFGVPLGCLFGLYFNLGTQGIWIGMVGGTFLQTIVLIIVIFRTDWEKEASHAEDRVKTWGGCVSVPSTD